MIGSLLNRTQIRHYASPEGSLANDDDKAILVGNRHTWGYRRRAFGDVPGWVLIGVSR